MWEATPQQSDLESDFLSYIQGAGQKIVAEYAKPIHKETSFLSMKPKGTLRVGGSTSVAGMMKELADAYMKLNPNADVEVVETDSTNGLTETMDGTYDLGMSSGDLKDYEKELLESVVIAKDEIQVIVNKDTLLDLSFVFELQSYLRNQPELFYQKRTPQASPALDLKQSILDQVEKKDVLLSYPFESMKPFRKYRNICCQNRCRVRLKGREEERISQGFPRSIRMCSMPTGAMIQIGFFPPSACLPKKCSARR